MGRSLYASLAAVSLKNARKLLALLCLLAIPVHAENEIAYNEHADQQQSYDAPSEQETPCAKKPNSYFLFGGNYTHLNFKPTEHASFVGNLGGAQASYEYRPANRIYEGVKFMWRQGDSDGSAGHRFLLDFDTQVRIGYTAAWECKDIMLTAFSGFGWRYLGHHLRKSGQPSIHFNYNEVYIPVGLLVDYEVNHCFDVGVYFTWMPQVFSTVNINPIGNARWVLERKYGNVLVELPMTYNFSRKKQVWSLNFKPFYEYWQDGKSKAKTTTGIPLDLPSNTYNFWGLEINLICKF